jgi:aminocarboxymuconate-semialdehyde decarboxylase
MTKPIIDVHAHILSEDMMQRMYKEAPEIGPKLSEVDADGGTLKVANVVQRPFPRGGWDLEKRFADLEFAGIDMQVLATSPQTFLYGIDKSLAVTFAQIQNEAISDLVKKYPDKFMGLAGLPLQDPEASVKELRRSMTELGLRGIHIGTHVENRNLDEPDFEPIWAEAERLGAFIVIHPHETTAANRTGKYYLKNIIGNPLETTIAGAWSMPACWSAIRTSRSASSMAAASCRSRWAAWSMAGASARSARSRSRKAPRSRSASSTSTR